MVLEKVRNTPLLGVSVLVKGTKTGTTHSFDRKLLPSRILAMMCHLLNSLILVYTLEITLETNDYKMSSLKLMPKQMDDGRGLRPEHPKDWKESLGYSISQYRLREFQRGPVKINVMEFPLRKKVSGFTDYFNPITRVDALENTVKGYHYDYGKQ